MFDLFEALFDFSDPHLVSTIVSHLWGAGLLVVTALVLQWTVLQRGVLPLFDALDSVEQKAKEGNPSAMLGVALGHSIYKGLFILAIAISAGIA